MRGKSAGDGRRTPHACPVAACLSVRGESSSAAFEVPDAGAGSSRRIEQTACSRSPFARLSTSVPATAFERNAAPTPLQPPWPVTPPEDVAATMRPCTVLYRPLAPPRAPCVCHPAAESTNRAPNPSSWSAVVLLKYPLFPSAYSTGNRISNSEYARYVHTSATQRLCTVHLGHPAHTASPPTRPPFLLPYAPSLAPPPAPLSSSATAACEKTPPFP